jgi:hypothetical protein
LNLKEEIRSQKSFSCKVRKKYLLFIQTKRYAKIAGNRRPNFGEYGVMARNPLEKHSLHVGWRKIFPVVLLCQFFGFWPEIGFSVTYLRI